MYLGTSNFMPFLTIINAYQSPQFFIPKYNNKCDPNCLKSFSMSTKVNALNFLLEIHASLLCLFLGIHSYSLISVPIILSFLCCTLSSQLPSPLQISWTKYANGAFPLYFSFLFTHNEEIPSPNIWQTNLLSFSSTIIHLCIPSIQCFHLPKPLQFPLVAL